MDAGLAKLVEVIASGLGSVIATTGGLLPWWRRKLNQLEAEKVKLLGAAQLGVDVVRERALAVLQQELAAPTALLSEPVDLELLTERARFRVQEQEVRRQRNLESISLQAALMLPESVSDEPVAADWVARFFGCARDVSTPELQRLWSALLAGEVAQPGAVSLRTLDVLRNLSLAEARMFEELRTCCCHAGDSSDPFLPETTTVSRSWQRLAECGLLVAEFRKFNVTKDEPSVWWGLGDLNIRFDGKRFSGTSVPMLPLFLGFVRLTSAGRTLMLLSPIPSAASQTVIKELVEAYSQHFEIHVSEDGGKTIVPVLDYLSARQ